jgi:PAS domain S-box-containing protein
MANDGSFSEQQARALLAAIVDSCDDAIVSKSPDGVITSWNRGAEKIYGYSPREAVGRHVSFLLPEGRMGELQEILDRVRRGERVVHQRTVRVTKEGRQIDVALTFSPILAEDGSVTGISAIGRDISEQIRLERSLRESEKRYRTLVEMAPDAVVVHQDGRFVYANCAALGIYGARSLEELHDKSLVDLVHPDEREAVRERIASLLEGEEIPLREYRLLRMDGREVPIETTSTLIDYQGRPSIQIIARDITERKRAEKEREAMLQQLVLERTRFETVLGQLQVGVVIAEAGDGRVIYHNEQAARIFRQTFLPAESFADYGQWKIFRMDGTPIPPPEFPVVRAARGETVAGEEIQFERGDGSRGYLSINAAPIRDLSGGITSGLVVFNDVTEAHLAVKALSASQQRLSLALDAAEMGTCDLDASSWTGVWSRRKFLLLGYPPPEAETGPASMQMWLDRVHPEDRERVAAQLEQAYDGLPFRCEHRIIRADNREERWVTILGRMLCDPAASSCRFISVIFDVSERKGGEEALRLSEERLRRMADSLPQIVWTAAPDGSIEYLNAHFELYTGVERDTAEMQEHLKQPEALLREVLHPDDLERALQSWNHAVGSGEIYQNESRIRRVDGVYHWHLSRALAERNDEGEIVRWYGTATDIHDLREVQEQLQASEARFRWLFESNLLAVFFWNEEGEITEANQAFCDLVGYRREECHRGKISWLDVTPPEFFPRDFKAMEEVFSAGMCKPYEKVFLDRRDGRRVPVLIAGARMSGDETEGIGFAVDLTELKRAEEALKTSEATLKLAVETTGLGIFDCDLVSGKKLWSDIMKRHFGLPPQAEVTEETLIQAVHPEDRERVSRSLHDALTPEGSGVYSAEYRAVGVEDGRVRWLTVRGRVSFDANGVPLRMVGACLDITDIVKAEKALKEEISERLRAVEELRRQEQLLIRQGRLAAMGEMIGNIAHQWRQPLNTLGLIIQELPVYYERNLFDRAYLASSVARAMQVIHYMSKTIDGFRNFFGPDKEKESFKVAEVLSRTVAIVEATFNELNLKIEVSADPEIVIYGYPNEFSQVLLNILVNAKDAILERKVQNARVSIRLFRENGRAVLTIADNAGGIRPEIMDRIFDPYFTTKGPDKGTGIGLFMSKTIIEKNMNGSLSARNTADGAEFRIEV